MSKKHPKMVHVKKAKMLNHPTSEVSRTFTRKELEKFFVSVTEPGDTFVFRVFIALLLFADLFLSKILIDVIPC